AILNQYALPPRSPGITRHADLASELARRGHHVTIVADDYDYLMRRPAQRRRHQEVTSDGVQFLWLKTGSYTGNDRSRVRTILRYTIAAGRAAMRLQPRPDVIIGSSPHPLVALSASAAATWLRVPWIFEARDIWPSALVDLGAL